MVAKLLGKSKGAKHPLPTYFPPNGEKNLPAAWAALSPFLFVSPGVCFLLLGWKIKAKAALGWVWHFLLTFFFFFPLPYLTISSAAMGWKSSAFPEKEPLELARQAEAEPSREALFLSPPGHPGRAQQAAEKLHGWAACCSAAFLSLKASQTGAQNLH